MILKVIYRGFKSFADTIEVDFSNGLTTVIGPNGCGKSNIVDGIRWVLGEQSAKSLRGGKMEDIIFHGTQKRKPSESAEVTLVLDNTKQLFKQVQTPQVSVTRRVFRKGGSEYLINGEVSRLKDVQNLFLDSGIGSRSYSLIGQEQAKKILSTKIEERRAIFEEAAGIVKFKQQKEHTEKELANVEQNLTRMADILHELERQLNPLKKQSEKAKQYTTLSDNLKTLEIQYLLNQYDVLEVEMKELITSIGLLETETLNMTKELTEGEQLHSDVKQSYQTENEDIFSSQNELATMKEEIDKMENEINLLQERLRNSETNRESYSLELKEIQSKHALSIEEYNRKNERLSEVISSMQDTNATLAELDKEIHSVENEKLHLINDYEFTRQKSVDLYNTITQKQFERTQLKDRERELRDKQTSIENSLASIQAEYESSKQLHEETEKVYTQTQKEKEVSIVKVEALKAELVNKRQEADTLTTSLQEWKQKEFEAKTKADSIESYLENNNGFFDGVKVILNEKKKGSFPEVYGALAELIQVDKMAEIAVDMLLQSAMQSIVTKDDGTAKECVNYLTKNKAGRATFLPINLASPTSFTAEERKKIEQTDGIRYAMDCVTYDASIERVVQSKLGRSLVADNLDIALSFTKSSRIKTRISTIQGEIVQTGSITGGASAKQKTNFFTKKRELDETKEALTIITKKRSEAETTIASLQQSVSRLLEDMDAETKNLESLQSQSNEQYTAWKEAETTFHRIHEKHKDLESAQSENQIAYKETSDKVNELKFDIERLEKNHEEAKAKLESLHSEKENQDGSMSTMLRNLNDAQTTLARLEEENKQLNEYMETYGVSAGEINEKMTQLQQKIEDEQTSSTAFMEQMEQLSTSLQQHLSIYETGKQTLQEKRHLTQDAIDKMDTLEQEIKQLRSTKETKEKELNNLNIKYSKRETEWKNILLRLEEDYEVIEENIHTFERQDIDMKTAKKEVESLRKNIQSLGNVNHNAIDEYEEIAVRFETESQQMDDAQKAKRDLSELLSNIEEEMSHKFIATFQEIATHFEETFVSLFEGGSAKLSLVDEKNPLTSEIEIIAQPPGKVSKSISLLSGGEQSLAAVALIFAIIKAKPSPFVILDEVDAPLDDSNIARFAKYLKKMSEDTQFIVITHRKGTKMESDFIYGVTHEQLGVSVVARVKFDINEKIG